MQNTFCNLSDTLLKKPNIEQHISKFAAMFIFLSVSSGSHAGCVSKRFDACLPVTIKDLISVVKSQPQTGGPAACVRGSTAQTAGM